MAVNSFLIRLSLIIIIIFGGTFILRYVRTGELFLDQMISGIVGVILLIACLIWRKARK